jgi:hypothetical protein
MVVMRLDDYVVCFCARNFATEVVEPVIFFKIEAWDETIHKTVVVREMSV